MKWRLMTGRQLGQLLGQQAGGAGLPKTENMDLKCLRPGLLYHSCPASPPTPGPARTWVTVGVPRVAERIHERGEVRQHSNQ